MSANNPVLRLGVGLAAIVLLLIAFAIVAIVRMQLLHNELDVLIEQHYYKVDLANSMRGVIRDRMIAMNKMALQEDPFERDETYLSYYALASEFKSLRTRIEDMALDPNERADLAELRRLTTVMTPLNDEVVELLRNGHANAARKLMVTQAIPRQEEVIVQLKKVIDHYKAVAKQVSTDAHHATTYTLWLTVALAGVAIALSSAIAVSVARRTRRDRQALIEEIAEREKRASEVNLLQAATSAANDANTLEEAVQTVLDSVHRHLCWPVGHAYILNGDGKDDLSSMALWSLEDAERFKVFREASETIRFTSGTGLPGRVLKDKAPAWIRDVTADANYPRIEAARACGIKAGFAFPVMIGTNVVAVLEFYSTTVAEPDQALLTVMGHVGVQLGRVMERRQAEARLHQLAHYDTLTGLSNRALFADRLSQTLASPLRQGRPAAVLYLDLDRFKVINDTLGHHTGDLLLQTVSQRLIGAVGSESMVARLGGDEFAIFLTEISSERDASLIAENILKTLTKGFMVEGQELFVTGSIGISLYPDDGEEAQTLMKRADVAMYRAKHQGKNNCQFYARTMDAQAGRTLSLETQLRRAVKNDELVLHYQPKVSLHTDQITGMEALVRWQHPDMGLIPPAEFIPLLEETGMIIEAGEWILRRACEQNLAWQRAGLPPMPVAVNLSARQISQQNMVAGVADVLRQTGLDPRWLELEITESMLMEQTETATVSLSELDAMGIHITIDDFGTGYSSLSYLKRFPISSLKIDRSFVKDIMTDHDNAAIASAVIAMAHSLKMPVIAEGVETAGQLEFLRAHGCDEIQGFYFGKPLPPNEFAQLLKTNPRLAAAPAQRVGSA